MKKLKLYWEKLHNSYTGLVLVMLIHFGTALHFMLQPEEVSMYIIQMGGFVMLMQSILFGIKIYIKYLKND